jgi:hypothetical protein
MRYEKSGVAPRRPPTLYHQVHLFVIAAVGIFRSSRSLLGRLLLLVLVLGLRLFGQRLLQDLENFLVRDLLFSLEFGQI